jgi:hypothetical protein
MLFSLVRAGDVGHVGNRPTTAGLRLPWLMDEKFQMWLKW